MNTNGYNSIQSVEVANHNSTNTHRSLVEKELRKQLSLGYYAVSGSKPTIVSPLGAILKDSGTEVRLIHDGSCPNGDAMNDYAVLHSVHYETLDHACNIAKPGYFMAKVDLTSAYRSVGIHPMALSRFKVSMLHV